MAFSFSLGSAAKSEVSVPFTRGTPLWLIHEEPFRDCVLRFSPLHEGDTSVALYLQVAGLIH